MKKLHQFALDADTEKAVSVNSEFAKEEALLQQVDTLVTTMQTALQRRGVTRSHIGPYAQSHQTYMHDRHALDALLAENLYSYQPTYHGTQKLVDILDKDFENPTQYRESMLYPLAERGGLQEAMSIAKFLKERQQDFEPLTKDDINQALAQMQLNAALAQAHKRAQKAHSCHCHGQCSTHDCLCHSSK